MIDHNHLTIRTNSRTTLFSLKDDGEIWFRPNWIGESDLVVINLEADQVISGGVDYQVSPSVILSWLDSPLNFYGLLGRSIHIPQSYDEKQQDHATDFYNGEHLDFDDVTIHFVELNGDRLRVKATGKAVDLDAEVLEMMSIEIDAFVRFIDRNLPPILGSQRTVKGVGAFDKNDCCWECKTQYGGHLVSVQLFVDDDPFEKLAAYSQSLFNQESIFLSRMWGDVQSRLPDLTWKFDEFKVEPQFDANKFFPTTFSISKSDDEQDSIHLNVFLTHPASGSDNWILRYMDGECYSLEWIPDR